MLSFRPELRPPGQGRIFFYRTTEAVIFNISHHRPNPSHPPKLRSTLLSFVAS